MNSIECTIDYSNLITISDDVITISDDVITISDDVITISDDVITISDDVLYISSDTSEFGKDTGARENIISITSGSDVSNNGNCVKIINISSRVCCESENKNLITESDANEINRPIDVVGDESISITDDEVGKNSIIESQYNQMATISFDFESPASMLWPQPRTSTPYPHRIALDMSTDEENGK